jgi:uncharacterized SAM-binding protein YcdF (DUF218 family)
MLVLHSSQADMEKKNVPEQQAPCDPPQLVPETTRLRPKSVFHVRFFRRRTVLWPTWITWCCSFVLLLAVFLSWFTYGESFLSWTDRVSADILVVEGWIGREGVHSAVEEFYRGGYKYMVTSGGETFDGWGDRPGNYARMAANELVRSGFPKEKIIVAASDNVASHRTFESAVAVWRALDDAGLKPAAVDVFTLGAHARRSQLVFEKAGPRFAKVGVIGWLPIDDKSKVWWESSERAKMFLSETFGYSFELLFNSGRFSKEAGAQVSACSTRYLFCDGKRPYSVTVAAVAHL